MRTILQNLTKLVTMPLEFHDGLGEALKMAGRKALVGGEPELITSITSALPPAGQR